MKFLLSWFGEIVLDLIKGLVVAFIASKVEALLRPLLISFQNKMINKFV